MQVQTYSDVLQHHIGRADSVVFQDIGIGCLKTSA